MPTRPSPPLRSALSSPTHDKTKHISLSSSHLFWSHNHLDLNLKNTYIYAFLLNHVYNHPRQSSLWSHAMARSIFFFFLSNDHQLRLRVTKTVPSTPTLHRRFSLSRDALLTTHFVSPSRHKIGKFLLLSPKMAFSKMNMILSIIDIFADLPWKPFFSAINIMFIKGIMFTFGWECLDGRALSCCHVFSTNTETVPLSEF